MVTLAASPTSVRADATSLLTFLGPPDRKVSWGLTGDGTITPLTSRTDAQGRAYAKYSPGTPDTTVSVTVIYVA